MKISRAQLLLLSKVILDMDTYTQIAAKSGPKTPETAMEKAWKGGGAPPLASS